MFNGLGNRCRLLRSRYQERCLINCMRTLDWIARKFLGRVLVFFVYGIVSFISFVAATIVLPYETLIQPAWTIFGLVIFAVYLVINILYHYRKASTVHPGRPKKSSAPPICWKCDNHKPYGAHHCTICGSCILHMDHHCIWINQCVGAKNHRHFLQFTGFLTLGCATFVLGGFSTFYYNQFYPSKNVIYCQADLESFPWHDYFCRSGNDFVAGCIFFSYFLCIIVAFMVGGLFLWNVILISSGRTYIDFLQQGYTRECCLMTCTPWKNPYFIDIWKSFLGIRHGRTFLKHILLPSGHVAYIDNDCEDVELEQLTGLVQIKAVDV